MRPYLKDKKSKKKKGAGDVVQVVEHLPSNLKALSSNPSTSKNEKKKTEKKDEGREK
jgi:hypothetical protein